MSTHIVIFEGSSNIISKIERSTKNNLPLELLFLNDGKVLVIAENSVALYKDEDAVTDPLGNGLINLMEFEEIRFNMQEPVVVEHRSGYVGLAQEKVLLILPNAIKLFHSKSDALQGKNAVSVIEL